MTSMTPDRPTVIGEIDTHKDLHMVAVVDGDKAVLGTEAFSTTRAGYRALLRWMRSFGDLRRVGIEGTGSYGAGITRHLSEADVEVLEVDRPDRADRRRRGKSDTFDAIAAAQAARVGQRTSVPKSRNGGRIPSGVETDPIDRGAGPDQGAATAAAPHRLRPRRGGGPRAEPDPDAADPDLRGLAA